MTLIWKGVRHWYEAQQCCKHRLHCIGHTPTLLVTFTCIITVRPSSGQPWVYWQNDSCTRKPLVTWKCYSNHVVVANLYKQVLCLTKRKTVKGNYSINSTNLCPYSVDLINMLRLGIQILTTSGRSCFTDYNRFQHYRLLIFIFIDWCSSSLVL